MKIARLIFGLLLLLYCKRPGLRNPAHGKSVPTLPNSIQGGSLAVEVFERRLLRAAFNGNSRRCSAQRGRGRYGCWNAEVSRSTLSTRNRLLRLPMSLGSGHLLTVTHTGLPGTPDLICEFRVYDDQPWGDIQVKREQHHR